MIVKYRDGSIYIGQKISEADDVIKMRIITGDTINIDQRRPRKIIDSNTALVFPNGKFLTTKGWFWSFGFQFNLLGVLTTTDQPIASQAELLLGKRFNKNLNIAIGMGSEFNEARVSGFNYETQFVSFFGYGRYYLTKTQKRLFGYSRLGYGFPGEPSTEGIPNNHNGGPQAFYGLGLDFASKRKMRFQLTIGHYIQKADGKGFFLDNLGNEIETDYDIVINRLLFKLGVEFR